jgi:hypothetical protein
MPGNDRINAGRLCFARKSISREYRSYSLMRWTCRRRTTFPCVLTASITLTRLTEPSDERKREVNVSLPRTAHQTAMAPPCAATLREPREKTPTYRRAARQVSTRRNTYCAAAGVNNWRLTLYTRAVIIARRVYQKLKVQRHPGPLRG